LGKAKILSENDEQAVQFRADLGPITGTWLLISNTVVQEKKICAIFAKNNSKEYIQK
jgi:hypothetical protein